MSKPMKGTWACALLLMAKSSFGQSDTLAGHYAKGITEAELKTHLEVLASDAYQGRDTGREGQKMAAKYLKEQFIAMGVPPVPAPFSEKLVGGYFQEYGLIEERTGNLTIEKADRKLGSLTGLVYFNEVLSGERKVEEVIWVSDNVNTLSADQLKDRVVIVDAAKWGAGESLFVEMRRRLDRIRAAGAAVILVSVPDLVSIEQLVHRGGSRMKLAYEAEKPTTGTGQAIMMSPTSMQDLLGGVKVKRLRRKHTGHVVQCDFTIKCPSNGNHLTAENVLAFIEGTDKKDEVVVITAHYDHIGIEDGVVYNGADDDGSGTVALLEIAEALVAAKADGHGPRRSVLVMPVSGEEKGLLGSKYYSDHPVFDLANTVADVNIDMIGRVDSSHAGKTPYVYVIGSNRLSSGLHRANEQANAAAGLDLDYTFNAESDPNRFYYRSDHYNFARKGVPSIFYFSGVHEDYHRPGDDVEKIRFDLLKQRALLAFHTVWILANEEERIKVDVPGAGN
ncbi:MAG TPA: M28 family peptidase [Flavobacteriales bacterium]|nr:M28 family peptidase [Flavobacteriales bacterium]